MDKYKYGGSNEAMFGKTLKKISETDKGQEIDLAIGKLESLSKAIYQTSASKTLLAHQLEISNVIELLRKLK